MIDRRCVDILLVGCPRDGHITRRTYLAIPVVPSHRVGIEARVMMRRVAAFGREQDEARLLSAEVAGFDRAREPGQPYRIGGRERAVQKNQQRKRIVAAMLLGLVDAGIAISAL